VSRAVSVGVDIVDVRRMQQSLDDFGARFVSRLFTDAEARYCEARGPGAAASFAARFAAKEATLKALDPRAPLPWRSIEVLRRDSGSCAIELSGPAAELARERGIGSLSVSLSHEEDYAIAFVVAAERE
jgi:holo-[acyl-carrier protein] synthase